jgi:hypothetical protein
MTRATNNRAAERIAEIESIIRERFPDAEFRLYRRQNDEFTLEVTADFDNMFDILELVGERTTDILLDDDILISVLPLRRHTNAA